MQERARTGASGSARAGSSTRCAVRAAFALGVDGVLSDFPDTAVAARDALLAG